MSPGVFVFNPFVEGYIARGQAFTPRRHQAMLAEDLATLPQFLCQPGDIVLVSKRPSARFLTGLKQAGFLLPDFVELREGGIDPADDLCQRELGSLRPWAWGPDSVKLLAPLFERAASGARSPKQYFNEGIAQLYSKAWGAGFLRKVLARWRETPSPGAEAPGRPDSRSRESGAGTASSPVSVTNPPSHGDEAVPAPSFNGPWAPGAPGAASAEPWLCTEKEAGIVVETLDDAQGVIAGLRGRGQQRVVVKEACGVAGHNALRLWEPEILPEQRRWLAHALRHSRQLVIEPWLERELDFSIQLEMEPHGLRLRGYTGLVNDLKGQFLANWAESDYSRCLPAQVAASLRAPADISPRLQSLYGEIFSLLAAELKRVGFAGPVSIDAFVYRTPQGDCRLKPVVEINPRYTMGRLTVELMQHTCPGTSGLFRLVTRAQARAEGFADLSSYAGSLRERLCLRLEGEPVPKIRRGALCLNDPGQVQVCLATFEVSSALNLPGSLGGAQHRRSH